MNILEGSVELENTIAIEEIFRIFINSSSNNPNFFAVSGVVNSTVFLLMIQN